MNGEGGSAEEDLQTNNSGNTQASKGSSQKAPRYACAAPDIGFKLCLQRCRYFSLPCHKLRHWWAGHKQQCTVWCAERERHAAPIAGAGTGAVTQVNKAQMMLRERIG